MEDEKRPKDNKGNQSGQIQIFLNPAKPSVENIAQSSASYHPGVTSLSILPPRTLTLWSVGSWFNDCAPNPPANEHLALAVNLAHTGVVGLCDVSVKLGGGFRNGITSEDGLVVALTKEMGVYDRSQKRVLEGDGSKDDADKDDEFRICNDLHCGIVVGYETIEDREPNMVRPRTAHL